MPWGATPRRYPIALPNAVRLGMAGRTGAAEGIRTPDPRITNALLYQLSYRGTLDRDLSN
jgi:hypothetical protein